MVAFVERSSSFAVSTSTTDGEDDWEGEGGVIDGGSEVDELSTMTGACCDGGAGGFSAGASKGDT